MAKTNREETHTRREELVACRYLISAAGEVVIGAVDPVRSLANVNFNEKRHHRDGAGAKQERTLFNVGMRRSSCQTVLVAMPCRAPEGKPHDVVAGDLLRTKHR